jgi:DNA topoisomerase-1
LKQEREKEKFKKAAKLEKYIPAVKEHIMKNLTSNDRVRRMTATVCWLILEVNIRVGDEKDPDEADTVGAITLRPEHIEIRDDTLHFDFLGKDAVRWIKDVKAPKEIIENVREFSSVCKEHLFEEIDSKRVSRFLSEKMDGLTAKVFRTWRCTTTVKEHLDKHAVKKSEPEFIKLYEAKMANLKAAIAANHKKKVPTKFDERLAKKETKLKELQQQLAEKTQQGKNTETLRKRLEKSEYDIDLTVKTKEYNLGTSLKSYIDPMTYVKWADVVDFNLDKLYPKTLRRKFYWALKGKCEID